ncbi:hypothetical protein HMPREF9103_02134 [Lentilactobacillus parafarraginis F0439]|uniref:Uncharacterized protein n=1 Tax=Lentilactobacillus parafarraginis F0439 TaxID=797515 RepID=G9ZQX6_9LACO|nr:hypothetical protein HMPREF9103_02134 [Lentilactobacillus parafarraginis F0439]
MRKFFWPGNHPESLNSNRYQHLNNSKVTGYVLINSMQPVAQI